ncbi:MAG: phosphoribosylanthranilate isomerase [Pseudomonadota bacterium]
MNLDSVKVKICGITRPSDALTAIELGANAVGFIFADSPRKILPETAAAIISSFPPFVSAIGVFVDEKPDVVRHIAALCSLDYVQLHGNESPEYCNALGLKVIKVFRVKDLKSINEMSAYQGIVGGFLLDTYVMERHGGTGKTFDWDIGRKAKKYGPIILSGGLNPENIREAIDAVKPYGVDINSGIEISPGIKDHKLLRCLFINIRTVV